MRNLYLEDESLVELWEDLKFESQNNYTKSLVRSISNLDNSITEEDIMCECYINLIKNDCKKLKKIRTENGIFIANLNFLRDLYRKKKKKNKYVAIADSKFSSDEINVLKDMDFSDTDKRMCLYFLGRIRFIGSLCVSHKKRKDGKPNRKWIESEALRLIRKIDLYYKEKNKLDINSDLLSWVELTTSEELLVKYIDSGRKCRYIKSSIPSKYRRNNKYNSIDDSKILVGIKKVFVKVMMKVWL